MMQKNYNYAAELGLDMSDMEFVQRYGLDPKVANTPNINDAIRKAIYQENMQDLTEAGFSEGQARSISADNLNKANEVANAMKKK